MLLVLNYTIFAAPQCWIGRFTVWNLERKMGMEIFVYACMHMCMFVCMYVWTSFPCLYVWMQSCVLCVSIIIFIALFNIFNLHASHEYDCLPFFNIHTSAPCSFLCSSLVLIHYVLFLQWYWYSKINYMKVIQYCIET